MKIFFLDDDKRRHSKVQFAFKHDRAYTVDEAKKLLSYKEYDLVFLDHDLDDQQYVPSGKGTGFEVAEYIIENKISASAIIVHSLNKKGADKMVNLLTENGYQNVYGIPFNELIDELDYWKEHFGIN